MKSQKAVSKNEPVFLLINKYFCVTNSLLNDVKYCKRKKKEQYFYACFFVLNEYK